MTFLDLVIIFATVVTGMLGIPIGILPAALLFRDFANDADSSDATKRNYAIVLWGGMIVGWIVVSILSWWAITTLAG